MTVGLRLGGCSRGYVESWYEVGLDRIDPPRQSAEATAHASGGLVVGRGIGAGTVGPQPLHGRRGR
jgi:hypothetical protein